MVTLRDVAQAAGVSRSTASRAFKDGSSIQPDKCARVLAVAESLGYWPSSAARSLRTHRSGLVGMMLNSLVSSTSRVLVDVVQEALDQVDYRLMLCLTHDVADREVAYVRALRAYRAEAAVVATAGVDERAYLDLIQGQTSVISVLRNPPLPGLETVLPDDVEGAAEATTHLLRLGHRRISLVTGRPGTRSGDERMEGYRRALREWHVPYDEGIVIRGPFEAATGTEAARRLLSLVDRPSAVFVANNEAAYGFLPALVGSGLRIPDDISVVCYEDGPLFSCWNPPLTVMENNARGVGTAVADALLRELGFAEKGEPKSAGGDAVHRVPAQLIVRASSSPPRAG